MASKFERPPGSGKWVLRAYVGMDRGKRVYQVRSFKGGARDAERAARAFQHEVDARAVPAVTAGTVGEVLEEFYAKRAWKTTGAKNKAREDLDRYLIVYGSEPPVRLQLRPWFLEGTDERGKLG